MKSLQLMLSVLSFLTEQGVLIPASSRVELKRTRSGSWRLYVACGPNTKQSHITQVWDTIEGLPVTANPFGAGGVYTAVTFVDDAEQTTEPATTAQTTGATA